MDLLRLAALALAVLAALSAFGWLLDPSLSRALGLLAVAFACYVVPSFTVPVMRSDR